MVDNIIADQLRFVDGEVSSIIDDYNQQASRSIKSMIAHSTATVAKTMALRGIETNREIASRVFRNMMIATHQTSLADMGPVRLPFVNPRTTLIKQPDASVDRLKAKLRLAEEEAKTLRVETSELNGKIAKLALALATTETCLSKLLKINEQSEAERKALPKITGKRAYYLYHYS